MAKYMDKSDSKTKKIDNPPMETGDLDNMTISRHFHSDDEDVASIISIATSVNNNKNFVFIFNLCTIAY